MREDRSNWPFAIIALGGITIFGGWALFKIEIQIPLVRLETAPPSKGEPGTIRITAPGGTPPAQSGNGPNNVQRRLDAQLRETEGW